VSVPSCPGMVSAIVFCPSPAFFPVNWWQAWLSARYQWYRWNRIKYNELPNCLKRWKRSSKLDFRICNLQELLGCFLFLVTNFLIALRTNQPLVSDQFACISIQEECWAL